MKREEDFNLLSMKCESGVFEERTFINYASEPPSLQHIALVSIAIRLWTEKDIMLELEKYSLRYCSETKHYKDAKSSYKKIEIKVLKQLSKMCLPESIKVGVVSVMRPIVLQLLRCFDNRNREYPYQNCFKFKDSIHWTVEGTIDRVKSLKELIHKNNNEEKLVRLFYFSCLYCLEECVFDLWNKLSEELKKTLRSEVPERKYKYHIVLYWKAVLENKLPFLFDVLKGIDYSNIYDTQLSINENMVSCAIYAGNSNAFKYFWCKLSSYEQSLHGKKWLMELQLNSLHARYCIQFIFQEYYDYTDIMCLLFSNLCEQDQREFFESNPLFILKALFFSWPFQRFLISTVTVMLKYIDKLTYIKLMLEIFKQLRKGQTNELFREVWRLCPKKLREVCAHNLKYFGFERLLWKFISVGDIETLFMIFGDTTSSEKHTLISDLMVDYQALFDIIYFNKLNVLDEVGLKCVPLEYFNHLKDCVMLNQANSLFLNLIYKDAFKEAEKFLNWGFQSSEAINEFKKSKLNIMEIFNHLMYGDSENLNQFMIWYFETKYAVCKFKKSFLHKTSLSKTFKTLLLNFCLCHHENSWERFEGFITWCIKDIYTSRKISQLKKLLLKSVLHILKVYHFDFATKLLNWGLDSFEEINQFKNKLLVSVGGMNLLLLNLNSTYPDLERVKDIIKWFSPISNKVFRELKLALHKNKYCKSNTLQKLCYLVNSLKVCQNEIVTSPVITIDLINEPSDSSEYESIDQPFSYNDSYYFI